MSATNHSLFVNNSDYSYVPDNRLIFQIDADNLDIHKISWDP